MSKIKKTSVKSVIDRINKKIELDLIQLDDVDKEYFNKMTNDEEFKNFLGALIDVIFNKDDV